MPFRRSVHIAASVLMLAVGTVTADESQAPGIVATYKRPAQTANAAPANDKGWVLGQRLFFDTSLSSSGTLACASCHKPDQGWTDKLPRAIGDAHKPLAFRAPTLLNAGTLERYGWSGRFKDVEAVAFFAMTSPGNMNTPAEKLLERIRANPAYAEAFQSAFPGEGVSKRTVGEAFRRFVASIESSQAPFDRWVDGDQSAISQAAKRGFFIFNGKARCAECHSGWTFTDGSFHDIGTANGEDIGRGKLFKTSVKLQYAFKTPTLRNVVERAPYMHDGSMASLDRVIENYDKGGIERPSRAEAIGPLHLTEREKADLVAFLETLSSPTVYASPTN